MAAHQAPWDSPGKSTGVGCQIMVFTYLVFLKRFCMCLLTHCVNSSLYQLSSVTQSCLTLCNTMDYSTPSLPVHHQLLELANAHVHRVSDAFQPPHPLWSPFPPTFNLSPNQGLFNESVLCIRWPKYWSLNFNISPSNEHAGLTSFRMDWLDLFAVQGTLKSLLQHHSTKASILQCSTFFIVQISHP